MLKAASAELLDINSDTVEAYRRDGVTYATDFLRDWIGQLREGLENTPSQVRIGATTVRMDRKTFGDYCNWRRIDGYRDFVLGSPVRHCQDHMDSDSKFHEHVLTKS